MIAGGISRPGWNSGCKRPGAGARAICAAGLYAGEETIVLIVAGLVVIFCCLGLVARRFDAAVKWQILVAVVALVALDYVTGIL
jgi:hypothetical protein